ncbi:MAG: hypothetical protein REH83_04115 [Rickettsiella sp.]|nr:hypothetical protein [Rickettsiella sp.]
MSITNYFKKNKKIKNIKKNFLYKNFIFYIYISIKDAVSLLLTVKKYFLKKFLSQLIYFTKKYTPIGLKIKIKYKILLYPKTIQLLKAVRAWLNNFSNPKKIIFIDYLLISLIRWIFLPILNSILTKKKWKSLTLQQLKRSPQFKIKVKKNSNLNVNHNNIYIEISFINIEKNNALTNTTEQIYKDLKVHLQSSPLIID